MLPDALLDRDIHGQSGKASRKSLYSSKTWVEKLDLTYELNGHHGCVNTLSWSQEGEYLVSGSDDYRLFIWSAYDKFAVRKVLHTGHMGNIFSAKFMPHTNNTKIISCAGDQLIKLSEVEYSTPSKQAPGSTKRTWYCHTDMAKRIVTEDNPNTFLSCAEDGAIRHHDLRVSHPCPATPRACPAPLISYRPYHIELTTLTMTKANPMYLIVGGSHPHAFLHDRRMIGRNLQNEWGSISYKPDTATQCVRRFSPDGKPPTARRSVHITACKFSDARPNEFVGSWSADSVYMFNIHDSPTPPRETAVQTKSAVKSNPTETATSPNPSVTDSTAANPTDGSTGRGKRKRTSNKNEDEPVVGGEVESSASSLDTGRQPPPLRESSVSAETTTSLTEMSSDTVPTESIAPHISSDAMGRQLTTIRRIFFTPANECTQQTFLMAHESVVTLLGEMRLAMYSSPQSFAAQREESIRFVTAIGLVCRILVLNLDWPSPVTDESLLSPIRNWDSRILRSWNGWIIQFIRLVTCFFEESMSPNNILRELSVARLTAPEVPLVALGGESILFDGLTEMLNRFVIFVRSSEKTAEDKRYWGIDVLRACILLLGDGINFAFIEGAFGSAIDEDAEEEAQMLLEAFEAARPPGIDNDDDEGSSDDGDEDGDVDVEDDDEDDDGIVLRIGRRGNEEDEEDEEDEDDEDDDSVPFVFFPTRRSGLNYPERHAAEDVPIVSHRKAYSGHCNVQTIKDVNYYGLDDEYVMSGSDDGILFIWDQKTSGIVQLLKADSSVTNVMTGHPYHPLLAASGIDNTVKIFSPEGLGKGLQSRQCLQDEYKILSRNDVTRQSNLRRTYISRDMLEALAFNIRAGRGARNIEAAEGCETM